ncbi:hypothetical protein NIE79_004512 [Micromonospora sp. NIE79]|uniref:RHIM domain-containing protein n=1 Tax=Micromonospora trifolii TaxID=2911208 RepID=A0ABS9N7Q8_9ACTN|nr:hypothetical protein [Micromonospora trifolii]MCG5445983.1 hypothetical protein [Micromonospora trifolii]
MDQAELIVSALTAGAASGITGATASAVGDAYSHLRAQLGAWLTNRRTNRNDMTDLNDSDESRQQLAELLREADPETVLVLAAAAERFLLLLDPDRHRTGRHGVVAGAESVGPVQQTAHAYDDARVFQVGTGTINVNER